MRARPHLPDVLPPSQAAMPAGRNTADLIQIGSYGAALTTLLPDLRAGHRDPQILDQAVTCYTQLGEVETALALMEEFVSRWPDVISGWTRLATLAANAGDTARALHALRQGFRRGPKTAPALALLNRLSPIPRHSASAQRLKQLAECADGAATDRAIAMHTLGVINDRAGRARVAFRWFSAANRCVAADYSPRAVTAMVAGQILRFDPGCVEPAPQQAPQMLFIVGMPRSGTTLVERMLQRHPQVHSVGESPALSRTVMAMRRHVADGAAPAAAWQWFGRLSAEDIDRFRQFYLSYLPPDLRSAPQLLVSKMPLDLFDLGAAHLLLPGARFLFLDRHPLDVGLSNFCTQFHAGHGFATRLDWTGHMIRSVHRSAEDYEGKLGDAFRRQSFRRLVTAPKEEIAAILSHAGVPWDPACLSPEEADRGALTASAQQVRHGINMDGLDRWHVYRDHLDPLIDALGGPDWIAAWEARDHAAALTHAA